MRGKENVVIPISGASHSGKTTFIHNMVEKYPNEIIVIDENIRTKNINIDEIRKNPSEYLDLEIDIINSKIDAEEYSNGANKIILIDRSLVDSYFYYTFYMDKSNFNETDKKKYHDFLSYLKMKMFDHCNYLYNFIFMFEPISEITRRDEYTVDNIENVQDNEYFFIRTMSIGTCQNQRKIIDVNPKIASIIIDNNIEVMINENGSNKTSVD